jgi:hypothetical protein
VDSTNTLVDCSITQAQVDQLKLIRSQVLKDLDQALTDMQVLNQDDPESLSTAKDTALSSLL